MNNEEKLFLSMLMQIKHLLDSLDEIDCDVSTESILNSYNITKRDFIFSIGQRYWCVEMEKMEGM